MSQEKVDKYKAQKARRKEIMAKEKRIRFVRKTVLSLVVVALFGWLGYSAYRTYANSQPREEAAVDYTALQDYMNSLQESE